MLKYDQNLILKETALEQLNDKLDLTQNNFEYMETRFNTQVVENEKINE